jgi:cyclic pyranopterin phosphate synthase
MSRCGADHSHDAKNDHAVTAAVEAPVRRLLDGFGRVATDLRVSVTDRCNLRCTYCMPAEGLPWIPGEELLSDDELIRLIRLAVERLGVESVRFTGGEPLLRPGLERIVAAAAAAGARTSITTNGVRLSARAASLAAAGLSRVNVSLDTLDRGTFSRLARRDRLTDVVDGLAAAYDVGLRPVKVNAVLLRGVNDGEAAGLLEFCLSHDYRLRFIEQMPLDPMHSWDRSRLVSAAEILQILRTRWTLIPDQAPRGGAPAETWLVDGGPARVGIVASVTRPFCASCDRTRLTADGQVRTCLFASEETDLRALLRGGASDDELADRWQAAMAGKAAGHGIGRPDFRQPTRAMSAIGG